MIPLTSSQCESRTIESVGLSPVHVSIHSPEFLASIVRSAATEITPCTSRELTGYILKHLEPLQPDHRWRDEIREAIEALLALGDLIEGPDGDETHGRTSIYLAPSSFVELADGLFVLLGGFQDISCLVPDAEIDLTHIWYTRRIEAKNSAALKEALLDFGFLNLRTDFWLKAPQPTSASDHVNRYDQALCERELRRTHLAEASILDSPTNVRRYSQRWSPLITQKGCFVGRRPQAFGSRLWCYMQVDNGDLLRHIDLPHFEHRWMAHDEAWHLQLALDFVRGTPQEFSVRQSSTPGHHVFDIFAPIPSWALRRWNAVASPIKSHGAWFSFTVQDRHLATEIQFAKERLWLREI